MSNIIALCDEIIALRSLERPAGWVSVPREVCDRIGMWLSAAMDDPSVCKEMKRDIHEWLDATAALKGEKP